MVASIGHYIDNKPVAGKSGRTGDVTNPATGEVTAKVAFASESEVDAAVQVAKKAQLAWAATPPNPPEVLKRVVARGGNALRVLPQDLDAPGGRPVEADHGAQQDRLAGARAPDQARSAEQGRIRRPREDAARAPVEHASRRLRHRR